MAHPGLSLAAHLFSPLLHQIQQPSTSSSSTTAVCTLQAGSRSTRPSARTPGQQQPPLSPALQPSDSSRSSLLRADQAGSPLRRATAPSEDQHSEPLCLLSQAQAADQPTSSFALPHPAQHQQQPWLPPSSPSARDDSNSSTLAAACAQQQQQWQHAPHLQPQRQQQPVIGDRPGSPSKVSVSISLFIYLTI